MNGITFSAADGMALLQNPECQQYDSPARTCHKLQKASFPTIDTTNYHHICQNMTLGAEVLVLQPGLVAEMFTALGFTQS